VVRPYPVRGRRMRFSAPIGGGEIGCHRAGGYRMSAHVCPPHFQSRPARGRPGRVGCGGVGAGGGAASRAGASGRNVEEFAPVEARWLRFTIERTAGGAQPCLDELEVYGPDDPELNLALASAGTRARASGTLPGYRIHELPHVHDGVYGNGHSWIADTPGRGWVELEFPVPVRVTGWSGAVTGSGSLLIGWRPSIGWRWRWSRASGGWWRVRPTASRCLTCRWARRRTWRRRGILRPRRPSCRVTTVLRRASIFGDVADVARPAVEHGDGHHAGADGWLWIGTTNGLARFDGLRFTTLERATGCRA
jgi:hypothetical protein